MWIRSRCTYIQSDPNLNFIILTINDIFLIKSICIVHCDNMHWIVAHWIGTLWLNLNIIKYNYFIFLYILLRLSHGIFILLLYSFFRNYYMYIYFANYIYPYWRYIDFYFFQNVPYRGYILLSTSDPTFVSGIWTLNLLYHFEWLPIESLNNISS